MTCGLVHTSYSLLEWQAVKLTSFAPWVGTFFKPRLYYTVLCLLRQILLGLWLSNCNWQQNELRHFEVFLTSKGENIAFPPPSPPCNVVPLFELPTENNKQPIFEWRGQGRGVDSFGLWSYPIWVQCLNNFVADFILERCPRLESKKNPEEQLMDSRTLGVCMRDISNLISVSYGRVDSIQIHDSTYLATWQTSWYPLITLWMCTLHFG